MAPSVTLPIFRYPLPRGVRETIPEGIQLADDIPEGSMARKVSINLLIGNDFYEDFMMPGKMELVPGLYMLETKLGSIITGRIPGSQFSHQSPQPGSISFCQIRRSLVNPEASMLISCITQEPSEMEIVPDVRNTEGRDPNLENLFNLDVLGIQESGVTTDDDEVFKQFRESVIFTDSCRYAVKWPWKQVDSPPDLPDNYMLAMGRLNSLLKQKRDRPNFLRRYHDIIQDQLTKGIIEVVTKDIEEGSIKHYIPHHGVETPQKETTKLRIVFDASAKMRKSNLSLNECLFRGPVLLPDLCGLLLRLRLHKVGILSDVEKAFLQVELQVHDRDVTRFLWLKDPLKPATKDNLIIFRFCRVPFGVITSPSLLAMTIACHLEQYNTESARKIAESCYVDNVITGANSTEEGFKFYQEAKEIFRNCSMNLREWTSNDTELMKNIAEIDRAKSEKPKVMGLVWDLSQDALLVPGADTATEKPVTTKRQLLHALAKIFDPLGFFSPATVKMKTLLQSLWRESLGWDSILPPEIQESWKEMMADIPLISSIPIPRFLGPDDKKVMRELCCFTDASQKAYSAAVYLKSTAEDGKIKCDLLFSKARLCPVNKPLTMPRLELLGVLIGTRLMSFVERELQIPIQQKTLWTDSKCVLDWLRVAETSNRSVFVENRLREIRSHLGTTLFKYIQTKENPADLATRGISVMELKDKKEWWQGPEWLCKPQKEWPEWHISDVTEVKEQREQAEVPFHEMSTLFVCREGPEGSGDNFLRRMGLKYSSLRKLLRVSALCRKFLVSKGKTTTTLTTRDLMVEREFWDHRVQLETFLGIIDSIQRQKFHSMAHSLGLVIDKERRFPVIRCQGRYGNTDLPEFTRAPKLLPKDHWYTKLVVMDYHYRNIHAGTAQTLAAIRQEYWIPQGRAMVKATISKCLICRRVQGGPYATLKMPPWPSKRVTKSDPFKYVGVDYLGPFWVKDSKGTNVKVWICLFTCMAVRAIHLEVTEDMTAERFLDAVRRFIARRGTPFEFTSDNALQFKLTNRMFKKFWVKGSISCFPTEHPDILSYVSEKGIEWTFIPEVAPWMGGFYERLVGNVKWGLRKSLGRRILPLVQMQTLVAEVEAVVNSRPLVYVGSELEDRWTLSPADFLGVTKVGIPVFESEDGEDPDYEEKVTSAEKLGKKWIHSLRQLDQFWQCWRDHYLLSLRERKQVDLKQNRSRVAIQPSVGDVVLIQEPNLPRGHWRIGKIQETLQSRDGEIRSAKVLLPNGKLFTRAVKLLYPLEIPKTERQRDLEGDDEEKESGKEMKPDIHGIDDRTIRTAKKKALSQIRQFISGGNVAAPKSRNV